MLIRNASGEVIAFRTTTKRGRPEPRLVETLAVYEALNWLEGLNIHNVCIETDSQVVCTALEEEPTDITEFGDIIRRCKNRLGSNLRVQYTRRSGNEAAHVLAR
ncbi:hypothetical protein LINPERHAP1_LOCUS14332 [Linum perenne]